MRRSLVALAVTASLLTPGLNQTPLLSSLWGFLNSLCGKAATDEGAGWDPDGRSAAPVPQLTPDEGAGWDPNG